jgi:AAR2 protein
MRTGFFRFFEAGEVLSINSIHDTMVLRCILTASPQFSFNTKKVLVRKWSNETEDLLDESEMETEQVERYKRGMCYPF